MTTDNKRQETIVVVVVVVVVVAVVVVIVSIVGIAVFIAVAIEGIINNGAQGQEASRSTNNIDLFSVILYCLLVVFGCFCCCLFIFFFGVLSSW